MILAGTYITVLAPPTKADAAAFKARREGLEVRDCFSIQTPSGPLTGLLLRAPLDGTVLEQTLRTGAGTLEIDAGRISTTDSLGGEALNPESNAVANHAGYRRPWMVENDIRKGAKVAVEKAEATGRFPSNFLLVHGPECEKVGVQEVGSGSRRKANITESRPFDHVRETKNIGMTSGKQKAPKGYGAEEVADWNCQSDCPVRLLDLQCADWMHGAGHATKFVHDGDYDASSYDMGGARDITRYGDEGGASRFFYQSVSVDEIKAYLLRLVSDIRSDYEDD